MIRAPKISLYDQKIPEKGAFFSCYYDDWETCREEFHNDIDSSSKKSSKQFFFRHNNLKAIQKFIFLIEKKLKIKSAKFEKTTDKNIVRIKPGKFWNQEYRIGLFTILLRCGGYYKKNINNALKKYLYCKATLKFLRGYTKIEIPEDDDNHWSGDYENHYNWHEIFSENPDFLKKEKAKKKAKVKK